MCRSKEDSGHRPLLCLRVLFMSYPVYNTKASKGSTRYLTLQLDSFFLLHFLFLSFSLYNKLNYTTVRLQIYVHIYYTSDTFVYNFMHEFTYSSVVVASHPLVTTHKITTVKCTIYMYYSNNAMINILTLYNCIIIVVNNFVFICDKKMAYSFYMRADKNHK